MCGIAGFWDVARYFDADRGAAAVDAMTCAIRHRGPDDAGIWRDMDAGVWLGHRRRFGIIAINVSNAGRAIPSFAILVVGTQVFGLRDVPIIGSWFVFAALIVLAVPPMVTNAYVAMAEVSDDVPAETA